MTTATMDTMPETALETRSPELRHRAQVRAWLYFTAFVVLCLVVVGGATRLTDSGLSITEWKPIHGVIPPLSVAEWEEEFALYKEIPEYQLVNAGMSLAEFKTIFWWEWGHRFLARSVGIVFALPLAFFWLTGRLDSRIKWPLAGVLALGGLQGFIGWWMVSSGLTERVDVSHYRLAVHLCMAALIFASVIAIARSIAPHAPDLKPTARSHLAAFGLCAVIFVQIWLGALVAGLDAGLVYNTWPMMGDGLFPAVMWEETLGWKNWIENPAIIQFAHRTFAYILLALVVLHTAASWYHAPGSTHARRSVVLTGLVIVQALVGIVTLVMAVPIGWALLHQATAFVVFGFGVAHWRALVGPLPLTSGLPHRVGV